MDGGQPLTPHPHQALVGDKTIAFWLMDKEMYFHMTLAGATGGGVGGLAHVHKEARARLSRAHPLRRQRCRGTP